MQGSVYLFNFIPSHHALSSFLTHVFCFVLLLLLLVLVFCLFCLIFLFSGFCQEGMAIVRDEVTEVLLEAEKGGGKSLRRRQWGVFWVLSLTFYGRMLVKEITGVAVSERARER